MTDPFLACPSPSHTGVTSLPVGQVLIDQRVGITLIPSHCLLPGPLKACLLGDGMVQEEVEGVVGTVLVVVVGVIKGVIGGSEWCGKTDRLIGK